MFDSVNQTILANAPHLSGLSASEIGQLITRAALSIRALESSAGPLNDSSDNRNQLYRLARTMEALVVIRPERENIQSAAFVAALAHDALRVTYGSEWLEVTATRDHIAPGIVAPILYAIGGSPGDAHALASPLADTNPVDIPTTLMRSIGLLLTGQLGDGAAVTTPLLPPLGNIEDAASLQLLRDINNVIIQMCIRYHTVSQSKFWIWNFEKINDEISRIKSISHSPFDVNGGVQSGFSITTSSEYPAQAHLVTLLGLLAEVLEDSSTLTHLPEAKKRAPNNEARLAVAEKRSFLWPNHINAIRQGLLHDGISAVVTYPTGAGKSTLVEMRIALTLDEGNSAIVLAPTNSLVHQTKKSLSELFPDAVRMNDAVPEQREASVFVMTPEKYLLSRKRIHENQTVHLLVFDEFHMTSSASQGDGKRSLDAMLCIILYLRDVTAGSVMLISAMVLNGQVVADWISSVTGRPCLNLDDSWRPNRQLRGMVAYDSGQISDIRDNLWRVRRTRKNASAPKAAKVLTGAIPYGLFAVQRVWSGESNDLVASQILDSPIALGLGNQSNPEKIWHLTANANVLAAAIAQQAATSGSKVIIFAQTIPYAKSIASSLQKNNSDNLTLIPSEQEEIWIQDLIIELGSSDSLYVSIDSNGNINPAAISHHGSLLPVERRLHESLYMRPDGVQVLVATSTLAQGMNLPADFVVIAGDSRYDPQSADYSRIAAHELLNAAGRAGRAGSKETGVVLLIPSRPLQFDGPNIPKLTERLFGRVFGEEDACLRIEDPLEDLLSKEPGEDRLSQLSYVAGRITGEYKSTDYSDPEIETEVLSTLRKSLSAQNRERPQLETDLLVVASRLKQLEVLTIGEDLTVPTEQMGIAVSRGVDAEALFHLMELLGPRDSSMTVSSTIAWIRVCLEQIQTPTGLLPPWVGRGRTQELSDDFPGSASTSDRMIFADFEWNALLEWIAGKSLQVLEETLCRGSNRRVHPQCSNARRFVLHRVPDFVFVLSLPVLVWRRATEFAEDPVLDKFEKCVREGFDSPQKVDLWEAFGRKRLRVWCHNRFAELELNGWS